MSSNGFVKSTAPIGRCALSDIPHMAIVATDAEVILSRNGNSLLHDFDRVSAKAVRKWSVRILGKAMPDA